MISMVVVFPAPLGPSRPKHSPRSITRSRPRMASTGDPKILGQRKGYEAARMRNPLAAAAIIALGGYRDGFEPVRQAICHYDYARLHMAEFFFAECAYDALPADPAEVRRH